MEKKLKELDGHCGNCKIMEWCAEPYGDVYICANEVIEELTEKEYIDMANEIREISENNLSNSQIERIIQFIVENRKR